MDTLIFAGLFIAWYAVVREWPRARLLAGWWVLMAACIALLAHHITSSLSLGLTY
jgi:hypothetical protein